MRGAVTSRQFLLNITTSWLSADEAATMTTPEGPSHNPTMSLSVAALRSNGESIDPNGVKPTPPSFVSLCPSARRNFFWSRQGAQ